MDDAYGHLTQTIRADDSYAPYVWTTRKNLA